MIPGVQNTPSQQLQAIPNFTPTKPKLEKEALFGNMYAVWEFSLAPGEHKMFTQSFTIQVRPQEHRLAGKFTLDQYQNLSAELRSLYLRPTAYTPSDNTQIKELAQKIVSRETDVINSIKAINNYCATKLVYGNPILGLYRATDALRSGSRIKSGTTPTPVGVDCGGFVTLFVSLCQAVGIPSRVVSGFFAGYEKNGMHAWAEAILPDSSLLPVDPSIENRRALGKTKRSGRFGFVGTDRIATSIGCAIPITVNQKLETIDILQNATIFPKNIEKNLNIETTLTTTTL